MVKRSLRILWECIGLTVAIAVIAVGVAVWRFAQGPVLLDFLTDPLERELSALHDQVEVRLGSTVLAWEGWPETFALRVRDVALLTPEGASIAEIPAIDLRLSVSALVHGTVAPTRITTRGATLSVVRDKEQFRFGGISPAPEGETAAESGTEAAPTRDVSRLLPAILAELMASPDPSRPLAYLEEVRIAEAAVTVDDRRLDMQWRAPGAEVVLQKSARGLAGHAALDLALGDERIRTTTAVSYIREDDAFGIASAFADISPAVLAREIPFLSAARGLKLALSGHALARVGLNGEVRSASTVVRAGEGTVAWPKILPGATPVREGRLSLDFDRAAQRLRARSLRVAFGTPAAPGPEITAAATAVRNAENGNVDIDGQTTIRDVDANELRTYWPPSLPQRGNAREWVTANIRDGNVGRAEARFALTFPEGDPDRVRLRDFGGRMRYTGLSVRYLPELPPVRAVGGTATFDETALRMAVTTGRLHDVNVTGGQVDVTGLHLKDQFIAIDVNTDGPLRDSLRPLAHPRLDLLSELGIVPEQTSGRAIVKTSFNFPLLKDLTLDELEVQTQAELRDIAIRKLAFGKDVAARTLDLQVNKHGMTVAGSAQLAGVPVNMTWREMFAETAAFRREVKARVPNLDTAGRRRLGMDLAPFVAGPLSLALTWRELEGGESRLMGAANLKDSRLNLSFLDWAKPPGEPGQARFDLAVAGERPRRLDHLDLTAGGQSVPALAAEGQARFDPETGTLQRLTFSEASLGGTRLNDVTAIHAEPAWQIRVGGGHVDAAPYLTGFGLSGGKTAPKPESTGTAIPDKSKGPPLLIETGRLDYVQLGPERRLNDVRLRLRRTAEGRWPDIRARATVPPRFLREEERAENSEGVPLVIDWGPREDGRRRLEATAANLGATLRAFDLLHSLTGGQLDIRGLSRDAAPGSPIEAKVKLRDFKVRKAPLLARLLSVALLTGIQDVLEGDGIGFQRLKGEIVFDDRRLETDLLHAYGPAIGLTAKGSVDLDRNLADLDGVLVPAALVNRILGAIPLVGKLITGGEGEGLIAMTYAVDGPLSDPEIRVNPLTVLAPGFLRGLFGPASEGPDAPGKAIPPGAETPEGR
jgi:hypothetical protein